jgi:hypothetical protein
MRGLSASDVLEVCERGRDESHARRALVMLAASELGSTPAGFADLTVGRRNTLLLHLRELTFGPRIEGIAACPDCREVLEVSFRTADLALDAAAGSGAWQTMEAAGLEVRFRPATTSDLVAIESLTDATLARRVLIARCVQARRDGRRRSATRLPAGVIAEVARRMSVADAQAVMDLMVWCPSCEREQALAFDIATFLWDELVARAPHLLREVHAIASAYGWDEGHILALSPWRRSAYLGLVGA